MVKKIFFLGLLIFNLFFLSCVENTKEGCRSETKYIEEFTMAIILTEKPYKPYNYIVKGIDLNVRKDTVYEFEGRWFDQLGRYWDIGDTIIKKQGDLFLEIHKKDIIHTSTWTCEGVFIDGISVSELARRRKYGK